MTAERLAARLGVTERAVRRYVTVLRDAGIPIESTTGRYGGYRLGRGTRLPPLMLSAAEALGLVMAVLEARPSAVGGADPVGSAIGKIVRVLPRSVAESVTALRQVSTSRTVTGSPSPDPRTSAALVRAGESRHRVRIRSRLGRDRDIEIDPWRSRSGAGAGTCSGGLTPATRDGSTGSRRSSRAPARVAAHPGRRRTLIWTAQAVAPTERRRALRRSEFTAPRAATATAARGVVSFGSDSLTTCFHAERTCCGSVPVT